MARSGDVPHSFHVRQTTHLKVHTCMHLHPVGWPHGSYPGDADAVGYTEGAAKSLVLKVSVSRD